MVNTLQQVSAAKQQLSDLNDLTKAVGEIALIKMRKIRSDVLANRDFLTSLQEVFAQVQSAYLEQLVQNYKGVPLSKITKEKVSVLQHNGMTVCVLISANTRLYGGILKETFTQFIAEVKQTRSEATIIGRAGLSSFQDELGRAPVTYFDFPDDRVDRKQLGIIISHLVQYDAVKFFYPTYKNVLVQIPQMMEISAQEPLGMLPKVKKKKFHFEPSLEEVMAFFEQEIFATYFEQTIREAQLAKFAARASSMDRASENITGQKRTILSFERVLLKRLANKKQISAMAAYL